MVIVTIIMCTRVACAALTFVIRYAAIMEPLDSSNNHADWPIPAALPIWECIAAISSGARVCPQNYGNQTFISAGEESRQF
jgi:hypothetical protein